MPKGDKQQLKADIEDGYWPVANLISEMLPKANLTGTQHRLLWVLFNRTYRWKHKRAAISLPAWAAAIGVKSTSHISIQLKDLVEKRVILRTNPAGKTAEYEFNTCFAEWAPGVLEGVQLELKGSVGTEGFSQSERVQLEQKGTQNIDGEALLEEGFSGNRTLQLEQNPSVGTEQKGSVGTEGYPSVRTEGSRAGNADGEQPGGTPKELYINNIFKKHIDQDLPESASQETEEPQPLDPLAAAYQTAEERRLTIGDKFPEFPRDLDGLVRYYDYRFPGQRAMAKIRNSKDRAGNAAIVTARRIFQQAEAQGVPIAVMAEVIYSATEQDLSPWDVVSQAKTLKRMVRNRASPATTDWSLETNKM